MTGKPNFGAVWHCRNAGRNLCFVSQWSYNSRSSIILHQSIIWQKLTLCRVFNLFDSFQFLPCFLRHDAQLCCCQPFTMVLLGAVNVLQDCLPSSLIPYSYPVQPDRLSHSEAQSLAKTHSWEPPSATSLSFKSLVVFS